MLREPLRTQGDSPAPRGEDSDVVPPGVARRIQTSGGAVHRRDRPASGSRDDRASWTLQGLAMLLAGLAATIFAIAAADGFVRWTEGLTLAGQLLLAGLGGWGLRRLARRQTAPPGASPLLVALGLLPLAWEPFRRSVFGTGWPFELLTLSTLRNVVLGLAILSPWRRFHPIMIALSLFLVLFGVISCPDPALRFLAGIFAALAVAWLAISHWDDVRQRLANRTKTSRPRWMPPTAAFLVVGLLGLAGGERFLRGAARGVLPSSGGTGGQDSFSRDGIGDGEQLVAGSEQIQSFAPIENAPFVSDHEPSLYDLFDDTYQEEVARPKDQDRAIGLPPQLSARIQEHLQSRVEKASREFSTKRKTGSDPQGNRAWSVSSDALFYVAGRVPLHLRLKTYDLFDGVAWYPEAKPRNLPPLRMTTIDGRPWLTLPDRSEARRYLAAAESHAIKVVRLDTSIIPAPLQLHGIHIDQVSDVSMYRWGEEGLIHLDRRTLPPLVPIHLLSRAVDTASIGSDLSVYSALGETFRSVPETANPGAIARLAAQWSEGKPRGWAQVHAITERLRTEYRIDREARPAADAASPVHDFLFHSRRGPDYQFATAAALLLRSLGYSTRVASGFYAAPSRYDTSSRHTPVQAEDVHFWTEVHVSGADWLTVEASPGYEVLSPPLTVWQRLISFGARLREHFARHTLAWSMTLVSLLMVAWFRNPLADGFDSLRWRLSQRASGTAHLLATLRLVERRSRRAGLGRPTGRTMSRWLSEDLATRAPAVTTELATLRQWIDEALYSPVGFSPAASDVAPVTRRVVSTLSAEWFRQRAAASVRSGPDERTILRS